MIRIRRDLLTRQEISTVNPIPRKRHILSRAGSKQPRIQTARNSNPPNPAPPAVPKSGGTHREKPHPYPVLLNERRCSTHRPPIPPQGSPSQVVHGTNKAEKRSNLFFTVEPSSPPSSSAPRAPPHRHLPPASSGRSRGRPRGRSERAPFRPACRPNPQARTTRRGGGEEEWTTEEQKRRPLGLYERERGG